MTINKQRFKSLKNLNDAAIQQVLADSRGSLIMIDRLSRFGEIAFLELLHPEALQSLPDCLEVAEYLCNRERYDETLALLFEDSDLSPSVLTDRNLLARKFYYLALCQLFSKQDLNRAVFFFQRSLTMVEGEGCMGSLALMGIGLCYQKNNELQRAEPYFERAWKQLRQLPECGVRERSWIYFNYAQFLHQQRNFPQACMLYRQGIAYLKLLDTEEGLARFYLGMAASLFNLEQEKEAKAMLHTAAELAERNLEPKLAFAISNLQKPLPY